jgi:hypothetical protein
VSRWRPRCEDCNAEVFGKCHFCPTCNLRRQSARQKARRDQDREKFNALERARRARKRGVDWTDKRFTVAATDEEMADLDTRKPAVPRTADYDHEPLAPALALQEIERAVSQSIKISGQLDLIGSKPWDVKVRETLEAAQESGCTNRAIDESIQSGIRTAGHGIRLPANDYEPGYILSGARLPFERRLRVTYVEGIWPCVRCGSTRRGRPTLSNARGVCLDCKRRRQVAV